LGGQLATAIAAIAGLLLALLAASGTAEAATGGTLFGTDAPAPTSPQPIPASAKRVRYVTVDRSSIASAVADMTVTDQGTPQEQASGVVHHPGRSISVQLFNGEVETFQPVSVTESRPLVGAAGGVLTPGPSVITWLGQQWSGSSLMGSADLTLVADGSGGYTVAGSIDVGSRVFVVDPESGDTHRLLELDPNAGTHPGDGVIAPGSSSAPRGGGTAAAASGSTTIDVLVGYASGTTNATSVINRVVSDTNISLTNTAGIPVQVHLVGVVSATDYQQSGSGLCGENGDLDNLYHGKFGLSALLASRETTRADLVGLMVPNNVGGSSGCAYVPPAGVIRTRRSSCSRRRMCTRRRTTTRGATRSATTWGRTIKRARTLLMVIVMRRVARTRSVGATTWTVSRLT